MSNYMCTLLQLENSFEHKCLEIVFKFIEHLDIMMHVGKCDAFWVISYFLLSPVLLVKITYGKVIKKIDKIYIPGKFKTFNYSVSTHTCT